MSDLSVRQPPYSFIVPVGRRADELGALLREYDNALKSLGEEYEIIVVLDGQRATADPALREICRVNSRIRVLELSRAFGESAALAAGFDAARGDLFVTLPAYYQVAPSEIPKLLSAVGSGDDMLIAVRWPRAGGRFDKLRRAAFHTLFKVISGMKYRDLGCGVRLLRRPVTKEIVLYGDQHRFLPALASKRGFRVREVELAQSQNDWFRGRYRLRDYLHGVFDVLTVFFLVRFTKKPLRFFGTIGFLAALLGGLLTGVLVVQRLYFDVALADRPALLLGSLLVVLGVQTFALGLIAELIIFTHARAMKEYAVRTVYQGGQSISVSAEVRSSAGYLAEKQASN